ncbi:HAD family hydrolase [Rhizobium sp. SAFR-030]|uniref:HAD family hydrolase n=1 Tax=Rhizobium sp. SAFR-030 TaxID=3387277 RepID=UPI003F8178E6
MEGKNFSIIFDLDGTIIDSAPVIATILNGMRNEREMNNLPLHFYRELSSQGGIPLVSRALEIDPSVAASSLQRFRETYASMPTPRDSLYPSARETLTRLKDDLGCSLAICSNKPERLCLKVLNETGIFHLFDGVVGGDTAGISKPDRRPVDLALSKCGTSADMPYFVGDSVIDQRAAKNAGIPFIYFAGGYDDTIDDAPVFKTISHLEELVGIVLNDTNRAKRA